MLTGRQPRRRQDVVWVYPLLEDAMAEVLFQDVETYISLRQNIFAQFITTRLMIDLCLVAERRMRSRVVNWWWEKYRMDLEGMQTTALEVKQVEGEEETDRMDTEKY